MRILLLLGAAALATSRPLNTPADRYSRLLTTVPDGQRSLVVDRLRQGGYVSAVLLVFSSVWSPTQLAEAAEALADHRTDNIYYRILVDDFNVREHFEETDVHREFIDRSFRRLAVFLPDLSRSELAAHDVTKYLLKLAVGYTARWVYNLTDVDEWREAEQRHYRWEPHHPQHYPPGQDMTASTLQESLVDMVALRWKKDLDGSDDVTNSQLVDIDPIYLERYTEADRQRVTKLIEEISEGNRTDTSRALRTNRVSHYLSASRERGVLLGFPNK